MDQVVYGSEHSNRSSVLHFWLGGSGGIRTHDAVPRTLVFKTRAFNHSATLPRPCARLQTSKLARPSSIALHRKVQRRHADRQHIEHHAWFVTTVGRQARVPTGNVRRSRRRRMFAQQRSQGVRRCKPGGLPATGPLSPTSTPGRLGGRSEGPGINQKLRQNVGSEDVGGCPLEQILRLAVQHEVGHPVD